MFRGICVKHRQTYGIANTARRFGNGTAPPEEPGTRLVIAVGDGRTSVSIPVALVRGWRITELHNLFT